MVTGGVLSRILGGLVRDELPSSLDVVTVRDGCTYQDSCRSMMAGWGPFETVYKSQQIFLNFYARRNAHIDDTNATRACPAHH